MTIVCTKPFRAVRSPADVHPASFAVGDVLTGYPADVGLRNGWASAAADLPSPHRQPPAASPQAATEPPAAPPQAVPSPPESARSGGDTPTVSAPAGVADAEPALVARMTRASTITDDDGKEYKIARGAKVYGAQARAMIVAGQAIEIKAE